MKKVVLSLLLALAGSSMLWADTPGLMLAADTSMNQGETPNDNSQYLGAPPLQPKDEYLATIYSVIPGIVFHGAGNFYAQDYQFGTEMLVMEIIGGSIALWGYNIIHQPKHWGEYFGSDPQQAGYWIKAGGVALLAVSWVGDVSTAAGAAHNWNNDHQIELQMDSFNATGVRLTLAANF